VLPQAKLQVASSLAVQQEKLWLQVLSKKWEANWKVAQPGRLLLATQMLCELSLHQTRVLT